jgi:hypothetical protein
LLSTKSSKVLNLKLANYIVSSNDLFFYFNYQKVTIKLYKFMYILTNLFMYNKKFIVSNFQKNNETNMLENYKHFLIKNNILTTWYPGFLSNKQQLENYADLDRFNFLSFTKPNFLLNFGKLISNSLYYEVETIPTIFLTTVDADEPVNNYCYFLPLNTSTVKELLFVYMLFVKILNQAQKLIRIFKNTSFLQLKYKLYKKKLLKKLQVAHDTSFLQLFTIKTRQNYFLKNYVKKKVLQVKKLKPFLQKKEKSLVILADKNKKKLKILEVDLLKNGFQKYYYKFYYNEKLNTKYTSFDDYNSDSEATPLLKSCISIYGRFEKHAKIKIHEYKRAQELFRTKAKNPNFFIHYWFFRYIKNKKRATYIGYIFKKITKRRQKIRRTKIQQIFTKKSRKFRRRTQNTKHKKYSRFTKKKERFLSRKEKTSKFWQEVRAAVAKGLRRQQSTRKRTWNVPSKKNT